MNERRQPWMKWFPSDWRADAGLRMCSFAARGLWIDLLALMHEGEPYGHLVINGRVPTEKQLAGLLGGTAKEIGALIAELEEAGVPSRGDGGALYSRRMVRDRRKAEADRANGQRGGNPRITAGGNPEPTPPDNGGVNPPANPPDIGADKAQKPEARSQRPNVFGSNDPGVVRAFRAPGARTGPDWSDPAVRKARWEQKAFGAVRAALPDDEATDLILRYSMGEPGAKARIEQIVRNAKTAGAAE